MGIVYWLLRRLPTEDARLNAIRVIWPELHTLSEKWRLLSWVEPGDDPENQLLGASGSSQIEVALREEIRNAPSAMLATEDALFWLLKWMKDVTPPSEPPLSLHLTPLLACTLIRAAIYKEEFHKSDQSAVQVKKRVLWEFLVENIGSQEAVIEAVNTCKLAKSDQVLQEAIQLIEQSLSELNLSTTK